MTTDTETETLSLPSLAIVTILGYLLYRYFFSPSSTSPSTNQPSSSSRTSLVTGPNGTRYRFTPSQLDTVSSMFPQLSRRDIMWDLQRNGGSVQATTERILGGRGLDVAPPSFQPILPSTPDPNTTRPSGVASLLRGTPKKEEIDLITRYNLQSRVKTSDKGKGKEVDHTVSGGETIGEEKRDTPSANASGNATGAAGWAATKDGRQSILQKRRDEMILEARRKMMERDAARGETSGS